MKVTIIIALLLASCAPAHAGGLAPSSSVVPPERPSYVPLLEGRMPLERCERPVYGRKGQILYWTGQGCVGALEDGPDGSVSLPAPTPVQEPDRDPDDDKVEEPPHVEPPPTECVVTN